MNRRIIALVAAALTMLTALVAPSPAAAAEPPAGQFRLRIDNRVCVSHEDTTVDIGGSLDVHEIGKHGVQQFRVRWMVKGVSVGIPRELLAKTKESARFPNDELSYRYHDAGWNGRGMPRADVNAQLWTGLSNHYDALRLVAKVTWDRSGGRRDWNTTVLVAQCS